MSRISHIFAFLSLKLLKRFVQTCSQLLRRRNTRDHREEEFQGGGHEKEENLSRKSLSWRRLWIVLFSVFCSFSGSSFGGRARRRTRDEAGKRAEIRRGR